MRHVSADISAECVVGFKKPGVARAKANRELLKILVLNSNSMSALRTAEHRAFQQSPKMAARPGAFGASGHRHIAAGIDVEAVGISGTQDVEQRAGESNREG
jgi:hypothetical protein